MVENGLGEIDLESRQVIPLVLERDEYLSTTQHETERWRLLSNC